MICWAVVHFVLEMCKEQLCKFILVCTTFPCAHQTVLMFSFCYPFLHVQLLETTQMTQTAMKKSSNICNIDILMSALLVMATWPRINLKYSSPCVDNSKLIPNDFNFCTNTHNLNHWIIPTNHQMKFVYWFIMPMIIKHPISWLIPKSAEWMKVRNKFRCFIQQLQTSN